VTQARPAGDHAGCEAVGARGRAVRDVAAEVGARDLVRLALGVAYVGSGFHGFAAQPGQRTVAGVLAGALGRVFGATGGIVCAGRTDAGVHARCQVVHVDVDRRALLARCGTDEPGAPLAGLARSLRRQLGEDASVFRALVAPGGFDARRSATWRRYRYELDCSGRLDPLRAAATWSLEGDLDLAAMRLGADALVGEHDFAGFCRAGAGERGPMRRRVLAARLVDEGGGRIGFEITATAFCQQMVRAIVGTLVAIGRGVARPPDVVARLRSGSRDKAPPVAPARGLCLVGVGYPETLGGPWQ